MATNYQTYTDSKQLYADQTKIDQENQKMAQGLGYGGVHVKGSVTDQATPNTVAALKLDDGTMKYYNNDEYRYIRKGTSGADEALLSTEGYNEIKRLQAEWEKLNAQGLGNSPEAQVLHQRAEAIRAGAGYSGGQDGGGYITLGSLGLTNQNGAQGGVNGGTNASGGVNANGIGSSQRALLNEWQKAAGQQATGQIDYAVNRGVTELERALADAQPMFKEQAEAVARDEMQSLDNSALYAEARGDRGGIGQSQYNEIQAAAAQNRLAVQQQQTKLSTDTARQIADLRAQGEFEKADKLLEITQQYLSQLMNLEQWAAEFGLSYQQFQAALEQFDLEFELKKEQLRFDKDQYANSLALTNKNQTADLALQLLGMGIDVSDEQLKAIGWTRDQVNQYLMKQRLEQGAQGEPKPTPTNPAAGLSSYAQQMAQALTESVFSSTADAAAYIQANLGKLTDTEADYLLSLIGY